MIRIVVTQVTSVKTSLNGQVSWLFEITARYSGGLKFFKYTSPVPVIDTKATLTALGYEVI